jgi:ArsR family transcriptional regulator
MTSNEKTVKSTATLFKALSDPNRLKLLGLLTVREMCVCELTVALGITQATASHHIAILERAGLVEKRKEGKWTFYQLIDSPITQIIKKMIK